MVESAPKSKRNPGAPAKGAADEFDPLSLDFTKLKIDDASVTAPAAVVKAPPPKPAAASAPPKEPLGLLDFSNVTIDGPSSVPSSAPPPPPPVAHAPAVEAKAAPSKPVAPAAAPSASLAGASVLIDIARQHAAGKTAEASIALEAVLRAGTLGKATEQGWGMLFDLLQILNRRQAFENLADAYAKRFERSAPAWLDAADGDQNVDAVSGASVALSGVLSAASAGPLKKLAEIAQKNPVVRLSLQKVTDADNDGCRLLLDMLRTIRKGGGECLLSGAADFAALLAGKVEMMRREREETWLLLLELYLRIADQVAFEDMAVNYAVTFEVSPPSWETPSAAKAPPKPVAKNTDPFALEGELLAGTGRIDALAVAAAGRDAVVIDAERLTRIDEVAARLLREALAALHAKGAHIRIRGVNLLVATLLAANGLDRIASLEIRRR